VPLSDLLDQRRPHRADAARNFDAILTAAREEFTDSGTEASLEDIARRAGAGPATLYRNFPTREDLIEAVYVAEVDSLCQDALRLAQTEEPWPTLVAWIRHFVTYMATERVLLDALDRESGAFRACRQALYDYGGPLRNRAQESGGANPDLSIDDVMRFVRRHQLPVRLRPATRTNPRHGHRRHRRPTRDPRPNKPQVPSRTPGGVTRCRSAPQPPVTGP
jgi:AcrR family transcriptional regulator